jgi:glycosyltransferase involved in cell wall biosynthesis
VTLHLPALPHVQLGNPKYSFCAYSQKITRLPAFLDKKDTLVYAPKGSHVFKNEGDYETHSLTSDGVVGIDQSDLMLKLTGKPEWDQSMFGHWDMNSELWQTWNARCIEKIAKTYQPGDVIGLIAGWCQKQIADAFPDAQAWEWGVGYDGVLPNSWVTFESNAWRSAVRGWRGVWKTTDSVIPNCYYADEFLPAKEHDDYLLFIGRLVPDKGLDVVREISRARPDLRLVVAGQGDIRQLPPNTEYMGVVGGYEKAKLLAGATALLAPTTYLEPFGGVTIEAAMSGTPAITTDYGVFPETIGGILGMPEMQCTTLDDFIDAVDTVTKWPKVARRILQVDAQGSFGAKVAATKYSKTLEYIEAVGRGESAWYGKQSYLLS